VLDTPSACHRATKGEAVVRTASTMRTTHISPPHQIKPARNLPDPYAATRHVGSNTDALRTSVACFMRAANHPAAHSPPPLAEPLATRDASRSYGASRPLHQQRRLYGKAPTLSRVSVLAVPHALEPFV
jgi:hypothetical protein